MTSTITILNDSNQAVIGEIVVENAYIYERINDKYTFEFTCYEQEDTDLLAQSTLIYADSDYFRIASIRETPIQKKFEVSCEHISYELNVITPEEQSESMEELHYEGRVWEIVEEILEGTRFQWIPSDDIDDTFKFSTQTRGIRSRIIEFCKTFGLEVHWRRFDVAIQTRRGADKGLEIELGENLQDLVINKTFNFNGTITTTYDIDFIDLNKVYDSYGEPLRETDFHMGDTVYLLINGRTVQQRGVAVGYDIFRRELPTIELESTVKDITEVIADGGTVVSAAPTVKLPKMYALDVAKDSFVFINQHPDDDIATIYGQKETIGHLTLPIDEVVSGVVVLNFEIERINTGATGGERTLIFEVTLDDPLSRNAINSKTLANSHGRLINSFRYDKFYTVSIPIFIHNNENVWILKKYPLARPYYYIFYRNPDTGKISNVSIDDTPENQAEIERYRNDPNTITMSHVTTRDQYERGDINTGISIVVRDVHTTQLDAADHYRLNFHTREDFRIHFPPTKGAVVRLVGTNFNLQPPTSG